MPALTTNNSSNDTAHAAMPPVVPGQRHQAPSRLRHGAAQLHCQRERTTRSRREAPHAVVPVALLAVLALLMPPLPPLTWLARGVSSEGRGLGLVPLVAASAVPDRPATIRFAFLHAVNHTFFDNDAVQLFAGLKAAEKAVNDGGRLMNTTLVFEHYAVDNAWPAAQKLAVAQAAMASGVLGFIAADWMSSAVAYEASGGAVPVIASRSLTTHEFQNPAFAFVNSFRMPIDAQLRAMVNHASNNDAVQCSYFALLHRGLFPTLVGNFTRTMATLGMPAPLVIDIGGLDAALDVPSVLNTYYASAAFAPSCALLFVLPADVSELVAGFYGDARFNETMMVFYSSDFGTRPVFSHPVYGVAPYRHLYFLSDFGDYFSGRPTATAYRRALAAWLATNPTLPASLNASITVDPLPATISYEGFMAGAMVGSVLAGTLNLTAGGWLRSIYDQTLFWVGDVLLGPFIDHCLDNPLLPMPCVCNKAAPTQFILQVNASSGRVGQPEADRVQQLTTYLSVRPTDCFPLDTAVKGAIRIQLFAPPVMVPAAHRTFAAFYEALRVQAHEMNVGGSMVTSLLSVAYMNTFITAPVSTENAGQTFTRFASRRQPFVVVSDWYAPSDITLPVINLFMSPLTTAEDPPLHAPTVYTRNTWFMKPTLGDIAHACALQLASRYAGRDVRVTLLSGDALAYSLAERSLHTAQFPLQAGSGIVDLNDVAALRDALMGVFRQAAEGAQAVAFFSTIDADGAVAIINAAVAATATLPAGSAAFSRFALVLATDPNFLYTAKFQLPNVSLLLQFPIYFGTHLMPFFEETNNVRIAMALTMNTSDPATLDLTGLYDSSIIATVLQMALSSFAVIRPTAAEVIDFLYQLGSFSACGVPVGPFLQSNCSAAEVAAGRVDRTCQCFKAMRTINVYDFRGWMTRSSSYNPNFQWTMLTCGPQYAPLVVAATLDPRLIVGIVVPCGAVAIAGLVYLLLCHGRRSNWSAPKDANVPFAMVFTDVQSSTSLWARAPEAMTVALEQHHELLRVLVRKHGGYEVKTIGDSFMVAFKRATDAAAFALAIQTVFFEATWPPEMDEVYVALAQEAWRDKMDAGDAVKVEAQAPLQQHEWEDAAAYAANWNGIRVRVGMHWGMGSIKLDPVSQGYDYYGTLVNTAARVEGVGNGGQVLATKDMFDELEAEGFDLAAVDVAPLGPQPLRGLDAPVPLYQLSPMRLRTRQFAALRLDVEVDLDDVTTSESDSTTQLSAADDTIEMHFERLLRRTRDNVAQREYLWRVAGFLMTALRATAVSWRKDAVKHLMKKWHVKQRTPPPGASEPEEKTLQYDTLSLAVRVGLAAEEAERAARTATATQSSESVSRHSTSRGSDGSVLRRGSRCAVLPFDAMHVAAVRRSSTSVGDHGGPQLPLRRAQSTDHSGGHVASERLFTEASDQ